MNDRGAGDYALWNLRYKEHREVDFLITERWRPYALIWHYTGNPGSI